MGFGWNPYRTQGRRGPYRRHGAFSVHVTYHVCHVRFCHVPPGEDLKKIQSGTWVGWKRPGDSAAAGGPLFVDDAFYNFLLPQRPDAV